MQRIERAIGIGALEHQHPPKLSHAGGQGGDLLLADKGQHEAAKDRESAKGYNQRRQAEPGDQDAVYRTQTAADCHADHQRRPPRHPRRDRVQDHCGGIHGECGNGGKADVDAARNQHHKGCNRKYPQHNTAAQKISQGGNRQKAGVDKGGKCAKREDDNGHKRFIAGKIQLHEASLCARSSAVRPAPCRSSTTRPPRISKMR